MSNKQGLPLAWLCIAIIACRSESAANVAGESQCISPNQAGSTAVPTPRIPANAGASAPASADMTAMSTSSTAGAGGAMGLASLEQLPPAAPMLDVQPWDGVLHLPELVDENPDPNIVEVSVEARPTQVEYMPGHPTLVWAYNGTVPGPVLRAKVGNKVIVHFSNRLAEPTTIHWHGLRVPSHVDGTAAVQDPVQPLDGFDYVFTALDAGTFWYHPHMRSATQTGEGLYGAIVIEDATEPLANMPADVLVLSDVLLHPDTLQIDDVANPRIGMLGREGNLVLVNGQRSNMRVPPGPGNARRLRVINASTARFFDLTLLGGTLLRIGGDRGLLEAPERLDHLLLVNGGRADLLLQADGSTAITTLRAGAYERAEGAGATAPVDLLQWAAGSCSPGMSSVLPAKLKTQTDSAQVSATRMLRLDHHIDSGKVGFTINGASFPDVPIIETQAGTTESWQITNDSMLDHPFHMHGFFFRHEGQREWKDSINIPRKQSVTILPDFDNREGVQGHWMYHCHILGHADKGMMGEVDVQ